MSNTLGKKGHRSQDFWHHPESKNKNCFPAQKDDQPNYKKRGHMLKDVEETEAVTSLMTGIQIAKRTNHW